MSQRAWGTFVFVAWHGGRTLAVGGLLAYFDHPILALEGRRKRGWSMRSWP